MPPPEPSREPSSRCGLRAVAMCAAPARGDRLAQQCPACLPLASPPPCLLTSLPARLPARVPALPVTPPRQDAHELFCGLLDLLQSEVLAREARRLARTCIRISETADPAARNFSFAVGLLAATATASYLLSAMAVPCLLAPGAACRDLAAWATAAASRTPSLLPFQPLFITSIVVCCLYLRHCWGAGAA